MATRTLAILPFHFLCGQHHGCGLWRARTAGQATNRLLTQSCLELLDLQLPGFTELSLVCHVILEHNIALPDINRIHAEFESAFFIFRHTHSDHFARSITPCCARQLACTLLV